MISVYRRFAVIFILLTGALSVGTVGFRIVEGWPWFDCFYMTLVTITTVGYAEIHELSDSGRYFASFLMLTGVMVLLIGVGLLTDAVLQLELADYFGRRRQKKMLGKLKNHYIVCGGGRVGQSVIREFVEDKAHVVLIDLDPANTEWAQEHGVAVIHENASADETLRQAGIERAVGLVACIGSDVQNVFVTLSARVLNPNLRIAARATDDEAAEKLRRAGATTVFTPYSYIGQRLAHALLRPHVTNLLDMAGAGRDGRGVDLEMRQVSITDGSQLAGKSIVEAGVRAEYGVIVLAVIKVGESMVFNPDPNTTLDPGDMIVVMGEREQTERLDNEVGTTV